MSEFHNLPFARDFGSVFRHIADVANKGLKAVQGMQSYPCTFSTPEKEEIIKAIEQS